MTTITPRVGDTTQSADQLNALWNLGDVLIEATGMYANGQGTFTKCWARPVPEVVGGEPGTWEVLVFGTELPHSLTTSDRIDSATVLYVPGEQSRPSVTDNARADVLAAHQVESRGVTASTPDRCTCGEAVPPEPDPTTEGPAVPIEGRRRRAFAAHQARALAAGRAETTTKKPFPGAPALPARDASMAEMEARLRAETTTATTEDAAVEIVATQALEEVAADREAANHAGAPYARLYDARWLRERAVARRQAGDRP